MRITECPHCGHPILPAKKEFSDGEIIRCRGCEHSIQIKISVIGYDVTSRPDDILPQGY